MAGNPPSPTLHKKTRSKRPAFQARTSRFDTENVNSENFSLRGFFTAFWIALFLYSLHTIHKTWKNEGVILSPRLFQTMSLDGTGLFYSDMMLIGSCFMCLIFQKLLMNGLIPMPLSLPIIAAWEVFFVSTCFSWVFVRDWPWLQSGFFALHTVSMLMKQHSYLVTNREMEIKYRKISALKKQINESKKDDSEVDSKEITSEIHILTNEITTDQTTYPANVTLYNFCDYMLVPTLVYDLQYPRTPKFRLSYFMEKIGGIIAAFFLLYQTVATYIIPFIDDKIPMSFLDLLSALVPPFMIVYFMIFFIIFEGICNAFAEITCFADRDFYSDWWNSTSFDEFARKWNRPVHEFLLRHVYLESLETYKISKNNATFLTFFVSSVFHELVMIAIAKGFRYYLFLFQMSQIPFIYISRIPFIRERKLLGNIIYWSGMLLASLI